MKELLRNFIFKFTLQTPPLIKNLEINLDIFKYAKETKIIDNLESDTVILKNLNLKELSFGDLNKDKIFYVIKRTPGTGMFSNITFILNHLKICNKFDFVPIIDMENFHTIYNEKNNVRNNKNAWNYYFENLNKFTLNEVYKSKNVLITDNKFFDFFSNGIERDMELPKLLRNKIIINKYLQKSYLKILTKFDDKNILGIHFRGTSYKRSAGHPLPATKKQMYNITKKILKKNHIDKIFLVTEEKNYLDFFIKKFGDKVIYLKSAYRSNKNDAFKIYPRNLHRYKLGREAILEAMLLSSCKHFVYLCSNISSAAIGFNIEKNQLRYEIDNGYNSKSIIYSQFYWYIKNILPRSFGGI
tara:strand:- start:130 stop:1200 length:1071 start_codon:yes stop_codon:yes gene_type:complete